MNFRTSLQEYQKKLVENGVIKNKNNSVKKSSGNVKTKGKLKKD